MRIPFICLFLWATITFAPAQEMFAPLIKEKTILFIHADLKKVDVDTLKQNWIKYSEGLMKALHFEASTLRTSLSALNNDLDKLDAYIRPTVETITKKLGIQEIAMIVDTQFNEFEDLDGPVIFVVPWKDRTDEDLQTLLSLLPNSMSATLREDFVPVGDFLFFAPWLFDNRNQLKEWVNSPSIKEGGIMQALKSLGNDDIKVVAAMTDSAREFLLEALKDSGEMPEPIVNMLTYTARKVEWAATSFSNPFFTPDDIEKMPPMKLTIKTRTVADAKMLRNMLESSIDLGIAAWKTGMMGLRAFEENIPETPEFFYQFSRGYLRTLLPEVSEDKLVFKEPDFGGRFWEFYSLVYGGFFYHMMPMMFSERSYGEGNMKIGEDFPLYGRTMQGEAFNWEAYRGKYVLVQFTTTWSGRGDFPDLIDFYEKYREKGFEIISVFVWAGDGEEGNNEIKRIVENAEIPWTIISEPLTVAAGLPSMNDTFGISWRSMVLVNKEGKVHAIGTEGKTLKRTLKRLLGE